MSQRDFPRMALIQPSLERSDALGRLHHSGVLLVAAAGMPNLRVPFAYHRIDNEDIRAVHIREDDGWACNMGMQAADWFSEFLETPCALVRMVHHSRTHHSSVLNTSFEVRAQDGYPVHLLGVATCDDLNRRASKHTPHENFRANLMIGGTEPGEEDTWVGKDIRIGTAFLSVVKLNERCPIPTVDQTIGELADDPWKEEPLRTLLTYRQAPEGGVTLGINCVVEAPGLINRGSEVEILG